MSLWDFVSVCAGNELGELRGFIHDILMLKQPIKRETEAWTGHTSLFQ